MANKKSEKFTASTGLEVTIKPVDAMFLQKVINSVPKPKRPTYTAVTASGRREEHLLDPESAKSNPADMEKWAAFVEERANADRVQNERVMNALFYSGTECEIPNDGWREKWEFLGVAIPENPNELRAFYLSSELPSKDAVDLMSAILRMTGVDEETLKNAEDAFRDTVRQ